MAELIRCKRAGYNPSLSQFQNQVGALWDNFFGRHQQALAETAEYDTTDFDIHDGDNEVVIRAELPGFEPGDISVELRGDVLVIQAERNQKEGKRGQPCQRLVHAEYSRTLRIPANVRAENIRALYDKGVLELHIPR